MQAATRPYLAAGVALFGAGAIAISPLAPPAPDIQIPTISTASVSLSAATDPLQAYIDLVTNTFTNVSATINTEVSDPLPILQQVTKNQIGVAQSLVTALQAAGTALGKSLDPANPYGIPAQLQAALSDLAAGDVNGAFSTVWQTFLGTAFAAIPLLTPITTAISQPVQNLANVLEDPTVVLFPVLGALSVAYATFTTNGNVFQDIVDAAKAGDPLGVVSEIVAGPARIADTFLNGDASGGGIFGPSFGLLSALRTARETIAKDITPASTATSSALTAAPQAKTVTLDVAPQAAPTTDSKTAETTAAAEDSTAADAPVSEDVTPAKDATTVKDSTTTKTATTPSKTAKTNPLKKVQADIKSSLKNATDGLKKATEKLSGKSKTKSTDTSKSSAGASSAAKSDAA